MPVEAFHTMAPDDAAKRPGTHSERRTRTKWLCIPTLALALWSSPPPVAAVEPTNQPFQSRAVFTVQQPLPFPLDEPGICLPAESSSAACEESAPASPASASPLQTAVSNPLAAQPFTLVLFWGEGCPHCADEKKFLAEIAGQFPLMQVRSYEVWHDRNNAAMLNRLAERFGLRPSGVPITFIGDKTFAGFSNTVKDKLVTILTQCSASGCPDPLARLKETAAPESVSTKPKAPVSSQSLATAPKKPDASAPADQGADPGVSNGNDGIIDIPLLGRLELSGMSLPVMTLALAGLDSFNPCAFFVLFALLSMLIHARSRARMMFIGGIFVFFSGFIYFLFMAAWLNLFLVMGQVTLITTIAGVVSVIIAGINIKDFLLFKSGVSLTIPDSAKPKLYERMRRLMRSTSVVSMVVGASALAIAANTYELLCTAGFPMVFTRVLTLSKLTTAAYYSYLALYTIVYVIPLAVIVTLFTITLGKRQLTEREGRALKLVSGMMMLGLGIVLIAQPSLLNNMLASVTLLAAALLSSFIVAGIEKRLKGSEKQHS